MKKIFACVFGVFFVFAGANAIIQTATTNTVRKTVYNIEYGSPAAANLDSYGYRTGVVPQGNELTTVEGTEVSQATIDATTVGNLAATTTTGSGNNAVTSPTVSIEANKGNIAVLKRDKLVVPSTASGVGTCVSGAECGYVTTGGHANTPGTTDKVWLRITRCTGSGQNITCDNP